MYMPPYAVTLHIVAIINPRSSVGWASKVCTNFTRSTVVMETFIFIIAKLVKCICFHVQKKTSDFG